MSSTVKNLGDLINHNRDLSKTAVIDLSEKQVRLFSFQQIHQLSCGVANFLKNNNFQVGEKIGILGSNSIEFIVSYLGILKFGAIAVLINPKWPLQQIQNTILDQQINLIFTDQSINFNIQVINYKNNFITSLPDGEFESYIPNESDIAAILYTSGSTGNFKKSYLLHSTHKWSILENRNYDFVSRSVKLSLGPIYNMGGLTNIEIFLANYGTLVLMSVLDLKKCLENLDFFKINSISGVPSIFAMLIKQNKNSVNKTFLEINNVVMSGEPVNSTLVKNIKQIFPNSRLWNMYGTTELGPGLFGQHPNGISIPEGSVGYPISGIEYRIVDNILQIKNQYTMHLPGDLLTDDGYFITNDLFEVDSEGFYYCMGRADNMFISGGNNIYPAQIEKILDSHPAVFQSATVSISDQLKGKKPYAFVVLNKGVTATETDLIQHLLEHLPPSHCPRKIWFLDDFPTNSVEKLDRKQLAQLAEEYIQ